MTYMDNEVKFTCILNRKVAPPQAFNAMAHALIGLAGSQVASLDLLDYRFAQDSFHSLISRCPVIILRADNASQLRTTARAAREAGLAANLFAGSMVGPSADAQVSATLATDLGEADAVALCLFGQAERLDPLTRKYSLIR
ncbi:MAG: hypothetical protein B7X90_11465 [Novosphingobium sp. 17-62-19]|uniref:DUF2000 family protein n=1 Tax=Novosphingobium sp. 17-62-19 TaxID=1970406 RepID=UPI000BC8DA4A|nr:DUF2000 family protein [Novosphingobium sp. 17-62-19]OZA18648.1 MAG: hypothetical protein B7X90_11465 [Novosphingobium sp. 17-62-19]HQS96714.1 DUF2000 family protein [Novosphingobium sp.]